jgi:flagellin-specific chaperone FliS
MTEKLDFLKTKLEELQNMLKQNSSAYKEVTENINIAQENKQKLGEHVIKVQGVIEGLQFAVNQLEEAAKAKADLKNKQLNSSSDSTDSETSES